MHSITFISTIHKETGKCNAQELCKIIQKLSPEVIFLEALDETYSEYQKYLFSVYEVYHSKLEVSAIQKCSFSDSFKYIPVLDIGMSDTLTRKYDILDQPGEWKELMENFFYLVKEHGFKFLNSIEGAQFQEQMRLLESDLLKNVELEKKLKAEIDTYENSMIRNIYSYCENNNFETAIFMCGVGHRKSIIEKIEECKPREKINLSWIVYECEMAET